MYNSEDDKKFPSFESTGATEASVVSVVSRLNQIETNGKIDI